MSLLTTREVEFLKNSNALANITNIDYASLRNAQRGQGHAGAFLDAQEMAQGKSPLGVADLCRWQRMTTEEQLRFGHAIPTRAIGAIRGIACPVDMPVAARQAPSHNDVPRLVDEFLQKLERDLRNATKDTKWKPDPVNVAALVGDQLHAFASIHPFLDANGRAERLLLGYLATYLGQPIVVIRSADRAEYDDAHRSALAMRAFVGKKMGEARFDPMGRLMLYAATSGDTDRYVDNEGRKFLIQGDELKAHVAEWRRGAASEPR